MALTLDIKKDLRFQQGAKETKVEIAIGMLQIGLDKKLIVDVTSLSLTAIEKLEKDHKKEKGEK